MYSIEGKYYIVKVSNDSSQQNENIKCLLAGTMEILHPHRCLVAVGDNVEIISDYFNNHKTGRIVKVYERRSFLVRKSIVGNFDDIIATNFDNVLIIVSCAEPPLNLRLLDTLLVAVEYGNSDAIICINKIDICDERKLKEVHKIYSSLGYKILFTSALKGIGIEELKLNLEGKNTLLAGQSGVGKSLLVNRILGSEVMKVGFLTKRNRGRHTTTSSQIIPLNYSTKLIDSPGFSEFQLWNLKKAELQFYFPDFKPYFQKCKFQPCTHTHEPRCAVKNALKRGKIHLSRYQNYLALYQDLN